MLISRLIGAAERSKLLTKVPLFRRRCKELLLPHQQEIQKSDPWSATTYWYCPGLTKLTNAPVAPFVGFREMAPAVAFGVYHTSEVSFPRADLESGCWLAGNTIGLAVVEDGHIAEFGMEAVLWNVVTFPKTSVSVRWSA